MQLFINNQKVDFTLQDEKNAWNVFSNLKKWGEEQKIFFVDFNLNGTSYSIDEKNDELKKKLSNIPVASIKKIQAKLLSATAYAMDMLCGINDYFYNLKLKLQADSDKNHLFNANTIEDCIKSLACLKDAISSIGKILKLNNLFMEVMMAVKRIEIDCFSLKEQSNEASSVEEQLKMQKDLDIKIDELLVNLRRVFFKGNNHILQATLGQKDFNLKVFLEDIKVQCGALENVLVECATNFQCSKDKQAIEQVRDILDTILILVMFLKLAHKDAAWTQVLEKQFAAKGGIDSWIKILNKQCLLLEEALRSEDYVQIGDILEYEFADLIKYLISTLKNSIGELAA